MKKILLIIILIMAIFQLVVLATAINIGNPPIEGAPSVLDGATLVDKSTPANGTGTITTVEVWSSKASLDAGIVAIFSASGDNLTTRDYQSVGVLANGYNSFSVDLDVVVGDYIGFFFSGQVEATSVAGKAIWYLSGNQTQVSNITFTVYNNYLLSIRGTGATVEENNAIFFGTNF